MIILKTITICLISINAFSLNQNHSAYRQDYQFKNLRVEHGLNSNTILSIGQDKKGFIWIGTPAGLQRFDGCEFKTYHKRSHYGLSPLFEDNHGALWMICNGCEVYRLNLATEKFKHYPSVGNMTWDLYHDHEGVIWAVTKGFGIAKYVHELDSFITYKHDPKDTNSINSNWISVIFKDSKKNVWIGTQSGLNLFDTKKGIFKKFSNGPKVTVLDIKEDKDGSLWLGTQSGLYEFNYVKKKFNHYCMKNNNALMYMFIDSQNNIWQLTGFGVSSFDRSKLELINYPNYSKHTKIDISWTHDPFLETKDGSIWSVAHLSLSRFKPSIKDFVFFHNDPLDVSTVKDDLFTNIFEDNSGNLWICTRTNGMYYMSAFRNDFCFFPMKYITTLYVDKTSNIWIGTENGIFKRVHINGSIHYDKINGIDEYVYQITEDNSGNLWIAAYNCRIRLNTVSKKITRYPFADVGKIFIDSKNRIWTGSWHPDQREKTWIGRLKKTDSLKPDRISFTQVNNINPFVSVSYTHLTLPTTPYV
jgi:ligand-binding sensor domain-containing protein